MSSPRMEIGEFLTVQEALARAGRHDDPRCPFCLPPEFYPRQLLLATPHFYVLAAGGQIVEGFVCIVTHEHRDEPKRLRCIADVEPGALDELVLLQSLISEFYADAYAAPPLFYENGRGGGTADRHPSAGFEFHPHLCALPGQYDLHGPLARAYESRTLTSLGDIRKDLGTVPYLYVHSSADPQYPDPTVYVARTAEGEREIVSASLRDVLALHNERCRSRDWHVEPGLDDLNATIANFDRWYSGTFIEAATRDRFW